MRVACLLGLCGLALLGIPPHVLQNQPPGTAVIEGAVPFTAHGSALITVRLAPDSVVRENLMRMTEQQILREQTLWTVLGRNVEALGPGRWFRKVFGQKPDNPDVIYEWQAVADDKSSPLRDQLLNLFISPDASVKGVADVFLFSRKQIEDRVARFAAQELVPVFEQHLRLAAAKAPTSLWLLVGLPAFDYDFQTKAIRFQTREVPRLAESIEQSDGRDLLYPAGRDTPLPARARGTANYLTFGVLQFMRRGQPASSKSESPTDAWRNAFTIGSSADAIPGAMMIASDRQLRLTSIPMDVKMAEQLEKTRVELLRKTGAGISSENLLSARAFVTVEAVELGTNRIGREFTRTFAVLFVRVRKVDVIGPDNQVLHSIPGSSLPAPSVTAPPLPAAGSPVPSKPPSTVQSESAILENLRKQSEAAMKRSNCKVEAMKVNPDEKSAAHQQKFEACMKGS